MRTASTATVAPAASAFDRPGACTLLLLSAIAIFIALAWLGASDVRGSDQYWYVADVDSLSSGRGVQTNEIYPVSVRYDVAPLPRPFIHNILNLYLVVPAAMVLGAYGGWIVTNVVGGLLTALVIYRTVILFTEQAPAALAATAYLLLPATAWLTLQPLAEATIAPIVALGVLVYVTAGTVYWRWMLLMVLAGILFYCRPSFLPLLPAVPLAYLLHAGPRRAATLAGAAGLLALGAVFWLTAPVLFEPHLQISYGQVLANARPGASAMNTYFDLSPDPEPLAYLLPKLGRALYVQFARPNAGYLLFYLPFNLLGLAAVVLAFKAGQRRHLRVIAAAGFFLLLHLATIVIVQNQFRYMQVATPPLLVAVGVLAAQTDGFRSARVRAAAIIVVVGMAVPSAALSWTSRGDGFKERERREQMAEVLNAAIPADGVVMAEVELVNTRVQRTGFVLRPEGIPLMGYLLHPRRVLFVSGTYGPEDYDALARNVDADWLLARTDSPILEQLPPDMARQVRILPAPMDGFGLFRVEAQVTER